MMRDSVSNAVGVGSALGGVTVAATESVGLLETLNEYTALIGVGISLFSALVYAADRVLKRYLDYKESQIRK